MPVRRVRSPVSGAKRPARSNLETTDSLPMVEIALSGVEGDDWVTETFRTQGASFRLLACRPSDRGRRRLVRLFEVEADGTGIGPLVFRLRTRLAARDLAVANLGRDRALLRVSVPLPAICSAAFDRGDFCVSCPFLDTTAPEGLTTWNVLVPQIDDARRLLAASVRSGSPRPSLVRAGAYRRRWGLTGRQEKAVKLGFELGYFDYPRRASLSAVAARLGVGRSTALELLRKATTKLAAQRFHPEPIEDRPS
ncbi:MAG: helix-turn-helix domain-containing protein [Thermoplasmata archaeon]